MDSSNPTAETNRAEHRRAYLLLTVTTLLWGGNAVAGKWAVGDVSPQVLVVLRWGIAFAALALFTRGRMTDGWSRLYPRWRYLLLMGASGYTAFASLLYLASAHTSAVNVALIQGAIPVLVVLVNFAVRHVRVSAGQMAGTLVTLVGAGVAATHGNWAILASLSLNLGDALMLVATLLYAGFTVALADRPKVPGPAFFTAMSLAAFLTSLPPLAVEGALGHLQWPTPSGWAIVAYVALGPTLLAQLFYIRGVELIGPNRAGLFVNLVPVFGAGLAVLLAGEAFGRTEALALALVLGGIALAERFRPRPAA